MELDRMTLNFGSAELEFAKQIRKRAGRGRLNQFIKQALREHLARQTIAEQPIKNS